MMLEGRWYVTHSGLLRIAARRRCSGDGKGTVMEQTASRPLSAGCWVFRVTVFKSRTCERASSATAMPIPPTFSVVHGAEMRVAETRAVNRASQSLRHRALLGRGTRLVRSNALRPPTVEDAPPCRQRE